MDLMLLPVCYWLSIRRSVRWQFIQHFFLSDGLDVKEEFVHNCQSCPSLDPCSGVGYSFKQTLGEKVKQTFWSQGKISDASTSTQGGIAEGSFNVVIHSQPSSTRDLCEPHIKAQQMGVCMN